MRKIVVPNSFLAEAAEALKRGETVKLHIDGQSMYPFIRGGIDLVEIGPCRADDEIPMWSCPFYEWEGKYMIHRYIGREGDNCLMLGDGNIVRIEKVKREEIIGLLHYIYKPDGKVRDCLEKRWLKQGEWWYRLRTIRPLLLLLYRVKDRIANQSKIYLLRKRG